jgi:cytidine deaminase
MLTRSVLTRRHAKGQATHSERNTAKRRRVVAEVDWTTLKRRAADAAQRSYSPYSGFSVGAAVQTSAGEIHVGTNVENVSFGLTLCAERIAAFNAVTRGLLPTPDTLAEARLIDAVVAVDSQGNVLSPCGACRQVILEFGRDAEVLLPNGAIRIAAALDQPFDKVALNATKEQDDQRQRSGGSLAPHGSAMLGRVVALSDENKKFLLGLLRALRDEVAESYAQVTVDNTRSLLFARDRSHLVVAPGYTSNVNNPDELSLRIPLRRGITGAAYVAKSVKFGRPGGSAQGHPAADALPDSEQSRVSDGLKWVVAWPLGVFGAVSLDGFDQISLNEMRDISQLPALQARVNQMAELLNE